MGFATKHEMVTPRDESRRDVFGARGLIYGHSTTLHRRTHALGPTITGLYSWERSGSNIQSSGVPKSGPSIIYHTQNSHNQLDRPAA